MRRLIRTWVLALGTWVLLSIDEKLSDFYAWRRHRNGSI